MDIDKQIETYFNTKYEEFNKRYENINKKCDELKLYVITDGIDMGVNYYIKSKIAHLKTFNIEVVPIVCTNIQQLKSALIEINTYRIPCMIDLPIKKELLDYYKRVKPKSDIEGLININSWYNDGSEIKPCTPKAIIEILKHINFDFQNKEICVVGSGETVGKPLSLLLLDKKANVYMLNSNSSKEYRKYALKNADCIVACSGKIDSVKDIDTNDDKSVLVINVGICFDENGKLREEYLPSKPNITYTKKIKGISTLTLLNLVDNIYLYYENIY